MLLKCLTISASNVLEMFSNIIVSTFFYKNMRLKSGRNSNMLTEDTEPK